MTLLTLATPRLPQLSLRPQGHYTAQARFSLESFSPLHFLSLSLNFFSLFLRSPPPTPLPQRPSPFPPLSHAWFCRESHHPPLPSLALLGHSEMYLAPRAFVINQSLWRLNHFYCSSVSILSFLSCLRYWQAWNSRHFSWTRLIRDLPMALCLCTVRLPQPIILTPS